MENNSLVSVLVDDQQIIFIGQNNQIESLFTGLPHLTIFNEVELDNKVFNDGTISIEYLTFESDGIPYFFPLNGVNLETEKNLSVIQCLIQLINADNNKENLLENVINQIKEDLNDGDTTAIHELLQYVNSSNLKAYLPE